MTDFNVDFLIAGAQKAGTTALAQFLSEHRHICLPEGKEAHVFDSPDFEDAWTPAMVSAKFKPHFPHWTPGALVGDATPISMFLPEVPERVFRFNPRMKWILLLREPTERALSHHAMERGRGRERWPAGLAFLVESLRLRKAANSRAWDSPWRWASYLRRGDYALQLDRILQLFPPEQMLILRQEDLLQRHPAALAKVYDFLGTAMPEPIPEARKVFVGIRPKPCLLVKTWLKWRSRYALQRLARDHGVVFGHKGDPAWDEAGVTATDRTCVVVLGTHRSGTSALTGALQACGLSLGDDLMPSTKENPKGYFEDLGIYALHERLLAERGLAWNSLEGPLKGLDAASRARWQDEMLRVWRQRSGKTPLFAFKDPRTLRFLPLWESVMRREGVRMVRLGTVRHPWNVAQSLIRRDGMSESHALRMWTMDNLELLKALLGGTSTLVRYELFLKAPDREIGQALSRLGLVYIIGERLRAFVDPTLDHGEAEPDVPPEAVNPLWQALRGLADGERCATRDRAELLEVVMRTTAWLERPGECGFGTS